MKNVSIFLADGCEEIEALTVVDILRRAEVHVDMVSVTGRKEISGSHRIRIMTEFLYEEMDFTDTDMLVLPGGMPGTYVCRSMQSCADFYRHMTERNGLWRQSVQRRVCWADWRY